MEDLWKLTYEIIKSKGHPAIKCLVCGKVSCNSNDIEKRYCGNCHQFHDIMRGKKENE